MDREDRNPRPGRIALTESATFEEQVFVDVERSRNFAYPLVDPFER